MISGLSPLFSPLKLCVHARRKVRRRGFPRQVPCNAAVTQRSGGPSGRKKTKYFWIIFAHTVKNNISPFFHNLSHLAFLKIPLSFFVRNAG